MQRQLLGAEMHGAVGDLAEKDRQKRLRRVDRLDERFDQAVELLVGRQPAAPRWPRSFSTIGVKCSRTMAV